MKRILTLSLAFAAAAGVLFAETLTPAEALERLGAPSGAMRAPGRLHATPVLINTTNGSDGAPAVYLFNKSGDGFLMVSADDSTEPLLAYSDHGAIDGDDLPPQLQWWLEEYARQVQYNKDHGYIYTPRRVNAAHEAIAPMIKTDWDQSEPYNLECPLVDEQRTYTGCVATAMAQVMNYWQYPERGKGSISYNAETIQKRLSLNFSRKAFDWANMLPKYTAGSYTQLQADAVAFLMKACGYAVRMDYGLDSSGALAMNIANGLVTYFDYDPNIRYELRQYHTTGEWIELLYNNLKNVGPILYGGGSMLGGGHSFICDGYDGNGYFHFNWGWTGMSNGYFSVDALNPYALGAGGGTGGGYNFTQDAVLGIRPPTGEPAVAKDIYLTQTGSLAAGVDNNELIFDLFAATQASWVNYTPKTLKVCFAALFHNENDPAAEDFYIQLNDKPISLSPGEGVIGSRFKPSIDLTTAEIPDGTYKVTMCSNIDTAPEKWVPVKPNEGYFNYVRFTKNGTEYQVVNNDVDRLEVVDAEIVGELYYGTAVTVRITIGNGSDHEMSSGFAPVLAIDGSPMLLGESILLTVAPGQTVSKEWTTTLTPLSQNFSVYSDTEMLFSLFDENTYNFYTDDIAKTVVMKPNPGVPSIEVTTYPKIEGSKLIFEIGASNLTYEVKSTEEMNIETTVRLNNGYFAYPLYAFVASPVEGNDQQMAIDTYSGEVKVLKTPGETATLKTTVYFGGAVPGKDYYLMTGFAFGSNFVALGPEKYHIKFRLASSGIEDVSASENLITFDGSAVSAPGCDIELVNMQGIVVAAGRDTLPTDGITPGFYIARAADKSIKISVK